MRSIGYIAAGLVLLGVTSAPAQQVAQPQQHTSQTQPAHTGSVLRIDPQAGVVWFDDGRMFQTTADTVIISGNQRVTFAALEPGTAITIYSAQPVAFRDGRYVILSDATGSRAVVAPPAGAVVASPSTTTVVTQSAMTPAFEVSGHVRRADATSRVLTLDDGRKVHLTDDTQVLMNGTQPVQLTTLKPGTFVVVRSVRPFAGQRNGDWVEMKEIARGTIVRTDQPGYLVLSDGRTIQMTGDTVVLIENRPVALSTIQPGARVVIYQNGSVTAVVNEPSASPALVPQGGLKEKENDRPSQ
jgi:hypothetical protein